MRGIILAAGRGSRLNGTAGDKPKCLVRAGGLTLVERQVRALRRAGIDDIVVVVGCQADRVRQSLGPGVRYVENFRFLETNSLYSLWTARALLYEGFVVLNCDVLFHPSLLDALLATHNDAALLIEYRDRLSETPYGDEEMKVTVRDGLVVDMSKTMDPADADGENLGIVKFGPATAPALVGVLDQIVADGGLRDWAPKAFREFAQHWPLQAVAANGYPWIEIDFPEDFQRAVREVLPAIESARAQEDVA
ncbi:MAG TPA: phosphocholine cytidylyltransferase family protein [Vicinamibacterales bacterium]|jgi:choline kinase